jgi:hypothetical protein
VTGPAGPLRALPMHGDAPWPASALAVMVPCGFCWAEPNTTCANEGQHFERYLRACRRGLISRDAMREICAALGPVSAGKLVADVHAPAGGTSPASLTSRSAACCGPMLAVVPHWPCCLPALWFRPVLLAIPRPAVLACAAALRVGRGQGREGGVGGNLAGTPGAGRRRERPGLGCTVAARRVGGLCG